MAPFPHPSKIIAFSQNAHNSSISLQSLCRRCRCFSRDCPLLPLTWYEGLPSSLIRISYHNLVFQQQKIKISFAIWLLCSSWRWQQWPRPPEWCKSPTGCVSVFSAIITIGQNKLWPLFLQNYHWSKQVVAIISAKLFLVKIGWPLLLYWSQKGGAWQLSDRQSRSSS